MRQVPWHEGRLWHGMACGPWLRLLARNRFAISPSRLPLAATVTVCTLLNSTLGAWQRLRYGRQVASTFIDSPPTFIIGHWRTGTTMLHELLALDPANRCPSTYESLVPCHFLVSERSLRKWLSFMLPKTRPMDKMRVGFDKPQEDEVALSLLGAPSPFLTVAFPNRPAQDPRYVDFDDLTPPELDRWEQTWRTFLQSLLVKRSGRLVLKSPQHTFRLPHILAMFPEARFIHLVRNPFAVFSSTVHFWSAMYRVNALQSPASADLEEGVLATFRRMHHRMEATRDLIPRGHLVELKYEDLIADPVATVQHVYDAFDWDSFRTALPAFQLYAKRSEKYEKNEFDALTEDQVSAIREQCRPYLERYGYRNE
jgi:hypothetical protein